MYRHKHFLPLATLVSITLIFIPKAALAAKKWPRRISGSVTFSQTYTDRQGDDYSESAELGIHISHLSMKLATASPWVVLYKVIDGSFIAGGTQTRDSYYTTFDDKICLIRKITQSEGVGGIGDIPGFPGVLTLYPKKKRWEILIGTNPQQGSQTTTTNDSCQGNSEPYREPASFAVTLHGRSFRHVGRRLTVNLKTKYDYIAYEGAAPVSYEGSGNLKG